MNNESDKKYYLEKFCGEIFILKIGGEIIESTDILTKILLDIKELICLGIKIILVHGGGIQADKLSTRLGHTPEKINGRRITTEQDLEIIKMVYGGVLNLDILSLTKKIKLPAIRVSGLDGNLLDVIKRPVAEIDFGFVGDIQKVNSQILLDLVDKNYLPIVSPLAVTNDGIIVNINADTIAIALAKSLQTEKLILFTNTDGIYDEQRKLISTLNLSEAEELIDNEWVKDGMLVKVHNCIDAVSNGIKSVHIISGISSHSLLKEIFTKDGIGTMITEK